MRHCATCICEATITEWAACLKCGKRTSNNARLCSQHKTYRKACSDCGAPCARRNRGEVVRCSACSRLRREARYTERRAILRQMLEENPALKSIEAATALGVSRNRVYQLAHAIGVSFKRGVGTEAAQQ